MMLCKGEKKGKAWDRVSFLTALVFAVEHAGLTMSLVKKIQKVRAQVSVKRVLINDFQAFYLVDTTKFSDSGSSFFQTD